MDGAPQHTGTYLRGPARDKPEDTLGCLAMERALCRTSVPSVQPIGKRKSYEARTVGSHVEKVIARSAYTKKPPLVFLSGGFFLY